MSAGKTLTVATAAYPLDVFQEWADYAGKIRNWVSEAAENGARLLVFPEYGSMELATLAGLEAAGDLEQSLHAVAERIPAANALHADLAREFNVYILAASAPVFDPEFDDRPVNRARFFSPSGEMGVQDKQIMTRFEREDWNVVGGGPLRLFETEFG
ncbi:MAG: nitrilase-related carbon-nitrogen hydrolase, partial [Pseudomonadota bacterium]|nr:nitrilase-related carbon-nitrogen hydrolase [Pseudomonadota bacterium]